MGWTYCAAWERKDVIREVTRSWENETACRSTERHCCRGNTLYGVAASIEKATGKRTAYILVVLMQNGGKEHGWGYKDIDESMGPNEVNCPLSYLDLATEPVNTYAREWRERVRAAQAKLEVGKVYEFRHSGIRTVKIMSLKPLRGYSPAGTLYRLKRAMIGAEVAPSLSGGV